MDEPLEDDERYREAEVRATLGVGSEEVARHSALKRRVFDVVYSQPFELGIAVLVVASVALLVFELLASPEGGHTGWMGQVDSLLGAELEATAFFWLDVGITLVFAVEYTLKLWIAPRKWYFVRYNWIDLISILPILRIFRLGRAVRLLRLLRLLRLVRVGVYVQQRIDSMKAGMQQRRVENEIIAVYLVFSLLFGTVGILVFEKGHNDSFQTLGDGLWWCVVTLTTVGYGDLYPTTAGGKVVAGVVMFIGLTFWALLTGTVSSIIIEHAKRSEGKELVLALSDHVVLCGWNETGERLVRDLCASAASPRIVVLQPDPDIKRVVDPDVHYVLEDPTRIDSLRAAAVGKARVAVVLADRGDGRQGQDTDARSILVALAIERLNPRVHTIVELLDQENVAHVRNASVDEVIVSGMYMGTMLSQTVQFPGLSDVFSSLFSVGEGTQVRQVPLPHDWVGQRFSEASRMCSELGLGVLLGYRRGTDLRMSPSATDILEASDSAVVLHGV